MDRDRRKKRLRDWAPAAACAALYLAFYLSIAPLLGPLSDDVLVGLSVWRYWRAWHTLLVHMSSAWSSPWPGYPFLIDFAFRGNGFGEVFLLAPFIQVFGHGAAALRWHAGACGVGAVLATVFLGRQIYTDRWAPLLAAWLLAVSPFFVVASTLGAFSSLDALALALLGAALLLRFLRRAGRAQAYWASFCLGLALSCREIMLFFIFGLGLYLWLDRRRIAASPAARLPRRRALLAGCLAAFMAPNIPLAAVWLDHLGDAAEFWLELLFQSGNERGVHYAAAFASRMTHWSQLFDASQRAASDLGLSASLHLPLSSGLMLLAAAAGAAALWRARRAGPGPRGWLLCLTVPATFLLCASFIPADMLQPEHLLPVLPLACLAAAGLACAWTDSSRKRLALAALVALATLNTGECLRVFRRARAAILKSGPPNPGLARGPEGLLRWIVSHPGRRVVVVPAAELFELQFLSGDELPRGPYMRDWALEQIGGMRSLERLTGNAPAILAFDARRPRWRIVQRWARKNGRPMALVDKIERPDGSPIIEIYEVGPKRPARSA